MNVYLAGATADEGWKEAIVASLPNIKFRWGGYVSHAVDEGDVEDDLRDLDLADALVAYCPSPSWSTAMEVLYAARICQLPVLLVVEENTSVSPWLRLHSDAIVTSLEGAVQWLDAASTVMAEAEGVL